ncbi:MAG: ImmA/IrrE family metallo-endopeptidase [Deltaproteobacteria bacterium]|nr:ImmA/IrrE family metallo-endopeptidase [Deltaproteobacteria bacterium]
MVKLIKTDAEYKEALRDIEALVDLDPPLGTEQGDKLELLTFLVSKYEEDRFPINKPDPIEAIRFRMEQVGLSQKDLIPYLGSRSKVSEVLNRKRPLTLNMIKSLNRELGIPAESLLVDTSMNLTIQNPLGNSSRFPIGEMVKRRWFSNFNDSVVEAKERSAELIQNFFHEARLQPTFCRQNIRAGSTMDYNALSAWAARVSIIAQRNPLPNKYTDDLIKNEFFNDLSKLSTFNEGPKLAREFLHNHGIHLIILRHLTRTHLDGAAMRLHNGTPVVALTLRYDRIDNFWFTLFHELAHLHLHLRNEAFDCFIDDLDAVGDKLEEKADELARNSLIPQKYWKKISAMNTRDEIRSFASSLNIHPAIVAGRLRWERKNYRIFSRMIGIREVRKLFPEALDN